ncbi:50S ribosomal protein L1 [Candidatus Termititenax persephonae]|uniref:Large ribosomal subunit protein uL1 n=1 Tax=Candidatus Termititenax persephonae TaxID=2218525 RepID=A0A388TFC3_9BACT|nr:50S ribosomal protein L1 [Candidatus Termititenax persephonae]
MTKHGKKYRAKRELLKDKSTFAVEEALAKVKELGVAKFDETIEATFVLGIDPKKGEQMVRGAVSLPGGLGKRITVAVITNGDNLKIAEKSGADFVGADDLVEKISGGFTEFDVLLATPDMMPKVAKLGKVLGRKGLMPTPKAGTVVQNVAKAIAEQKAGKVEYKTDKAGVIHTIIGKKSFEVPKLKANYEALYEAIVKAKPATVKGNYLKGIYLAPTMGPGVKVLASVN